jgi:diguanylate cyclase (GGDEF)-like protein/PAS domain S-box-containing protein
METRSPALLGNFIDLLLDAVCTVDATGRFVSASAACERIFGYTPAEMIGRQMIDLVAPQDRARTLQAAAEIMSGQPKLHFENRYVRKDGRIVHVMWTALWSEPDQLRIAVARDITELKKAETLQSALYAISEAAHAADDLAALLELIHQTLKDLLPADNFFVAMVDEGGGRPTFPYCADEGATGDTQERADPAVHALCMEVILSEQPLLLPPGSIGALSEHLGAAGDGPVPCWLGVPLVSDKGSIGALVLKSRPGGPHYTESDRDLLHFVSTQITTAVERLQLRARLQQMAQYDDLTGLPNRALLRDRLDTALAAARRDKGRIALLYLDLDRFKEINDTLGHAAGDELLQAVARRMKHCVRDADTVARIGGDEFVVLLPGTQLPEHAELVAAKIHEAVARPMEIAGRTLCILPSIGIALYPEHGEDAPQLLKRADEAMYAAKQRTGATIVQT